MAILNLPPSPAQILFQKMCLRKSERKDRQILTGQNKFVIVRC